MVKQLFYKSFFVCLFPLLTGCSPKSRPDLTNSDKQFSPLGFWFGLTKLRTEPIDCASSFSKPLRYCSLEIDTSKWIDVLKSSKSTIDSITVELPGLDGGFHPAMVARSASVPLEWELKYGIMAFSGRISNSPISMVRLELDSSGLRVMYTDAGTTVFVSRMCDESKLKYIAFSKDDMPAGAKSIFE
ncbi:MAG: hypothetical protein RL090_314 [Bacteroidota bacterium]